MLAIFNSLFVPIDKSFTLEDGPSKSLLSIFDIIIDFIFLIDIILMLFTSYQNRKGEEVIDLGKIVRHYVFTFNFFVDFMSVLAMFKHIIVQFGILGLFKLFRIKRL